MRLIGCSRVATFSLRLRAKRRALALVEKCERVHLLGGEPHELVLLQKDACLFTPNSMAASCAQRAARTNYRFRLRRRSLDYGPEHGIILLRVVKRLVPRTLRSSRLEHADS